MFVCEFYTEASTTFLLLKCLWTLVSEVCVLESACNYDIKRTLTLHNARIWGYIVLVGTHTINVFYVHLNDPVREPHMFLTVFVYE